MKKLLTSLFILFFGICSAQNFNAGFIGGLTMSQISGDGYSGYNKVGPRIGAYVNYPLKKKMSLQIGIQYLQKGSEENDVDANNFYSYKLDYLEIPFTFNYQIKEFIYLESGIGSNYLLGFNESESNTEPNKLSMDFILGTQYQFNKNVLFNFRFAHSLTKIRKHSSNGTSGLNKGEYSNLISLALIYQISR